ncbi:MAG: hypothetical protein J3Q66DRAFT_445096 [Benniella sp.]|nr:MAG: hypothetical protein J3Q66DRAFT_445096 [Benniella sp.]
MPKENVLIRHVLSTTFVLSQGRRILRWLSTVIQGLCAILARPRVCTTYRQAGAEDGHFLFQNPLAGPRAILVERKGLNGPAAGEGRNPVAHEYAQQLDIIS